MQIKVPSIWQDFLSLKKYPKEISRIETFLHREYTQGKIIYPSTENIFKALELVTPENVKVVILGQDPYHQTGQAHGLAFSVPEGFPLPPSLRNIFKELDSEFGEEKRSGNLESWARQGVLLLNTVLTVEHGKAHSHQGSGWEWFTDHIIQCIQASSSHSVFILWGAQAQTKATIIDNERHLVLCSAHPSPLSAYRGFFGNKHFKQANAYLGDHGIHPIRW